MHRKLQSKNDALKIMRAELEKYRSERDQFKLMAETLQLRYSAIKNSLTNCDQGGFNAYGGSSVGTMLNESRGRNMTLQTEVEALRQKVTDLQGDIKCLRQKHVDVKPAGARVRKKLDTVDDSAAEKSNLIAQMEAIKKKNAQLQYDFRSLLDEKEEVVTERDAYKCKAHRLNHELNVALQGDKGQAKFIDIDALILENKYLQERIANFETEVELLKQSSAKYKVSGNREKWRKFD
jgi:predicted  nucleic acid-binding Zn-ribbon protein